ncbi:Arrestin-C domain-containing protein [Mycena kentingensis (nom. inval.)]|nr:Arrestin-C domain-containing protein [Mycena kentingensis (nom. inval.)]
MPKNALTIRLNEAAVFVRTNENNARRRTDDTGSRSSMLRGLLTLELAKPTKITSIDLELQAKSFTIWPEGVGARRVEVQEEHKVFSESVVFFRASPAPRRHASVGPGVQPEHAAPGHTPTTPETPQFDLPRAVRRGSADSSYFHNRESYEQGPPVPPYTPLPSPPSSAASPSASTSNCASPAPSLSHFATEDPAHALEDFRNALRANLPLSRNGTGDRSSASSVRELDRSLSRRPSIDTLAEVDEDRDRQAYEPPVVHTQPQTQTQTQTTPTGSPAPDSRGRRSRFSLTSVLKDVVRSGSPSLRARSSSAKGREESVRRGRTREKSVTIQEPASSKERHHHHTLSQLIGLKDDREKDKSESSSWKEFKKGTYAYPISFMIPATAPPSMSCPWGSLTWRLKANVHRPGALTSRMTASRDVMIVAAPTEDDAEETENVVVERHWEQQLQYLISISGRSFPIGGTIPVSLTLMPMAKVKIYRMTVLLEEKIEYHSAAKRAVRADPVVRMPLLAVKHEDPDAGAILPLDSDAPDALQSSPLLAWTNLSDDLSELASDWMGPGPWSFHNELQLPASCGALHFTNKNKRSGMTVTHLLKCVIRVERGDDAAVDPKTGKRKLFDIVVQTPVHILSCRCNPEWMSLPRYSGSFADEDTAEVVPMCPCQTARPAVLERLQTHHSSDSAASVHETSPVRRHQRGDTLLARNTLFERLVSGQESEGGEAPPAYVNTL